MSRLGDLIRTERLARGLPIKQVAKMGGVNERFLTEVERGERIIADDLAARILKKMGTSDEALMPFESAVLPEPTQAQRTPVAARKAVEPEPLAEPSQAWMDALGGVIKQVPQFSSGMHPVGQRVMATQQGRIEGYPADKVFYIRVEDDGLRGMGVYRGDWLLMAPCTDALDGAIQLVDLGGGFGLYYVTTLEGNRALLQVFDERPAGKIVEMRQVTFKARAIRVERAL